MNIIRVFTIIMLFFFLSSGGSAIAGSTAFGNKIFDTGRLKPVDSILAVKVGDQAPDFRLRSIRGNDIHLNSFIGKKNVVLSFIPAAWTPVCSDQWPGYNIAENLFKQYDTTLIGISVDNLPTLFAWTREMGGGLWFDVVSDFWPHGAVSRAYGVLRSDGTAERAIFIIDKNGILKLTHVGDINVRPDLGMIVQALKKLNN